MIFAFVIAALLLVVALATDSTVMIYFLTRALTESWVMWKLGTYIALVLVGLVNMVSKHA